MKYVNGLHEAKLLLDTRERVVSATESHDVVLSAEATVREIIQAVRTDGDNAVNLYTQTFDKVELPSIEVEKETIDDAYATSPKSLIDSLLIASERVRTFHERSMPKSWHDESNGYGEKFGPVKTAGIYIPGGSAAYPSSVLMTAIPARVAGVSEIVVCTPANGTRGPDPSVLAACRICGVDRVFAVGGAQAIAGMAYGTETIPRVDLICGPGNRYVTLAKKMVYGDVGVDGLYGPTETIVIAEDTADPRHCAADLLAQAEHDVLATPILIATSENLIRSVEEQLKIQLNQLSRSSIAEASLNNNGLLIRVNSVAEAIEISNEFAPEHLCLLVNNPESYLPIVKNAGAVFLGHGTPEVLGDFVAGPSHVMPTGGTAKFSSPLGVHQFLKVTSTVAFSPSLLQELQEATSIIAKHEGFTGHAKAIEVRITENPDS